MRTLFANGCTVGGDAYSSDKNRSDGLLSVLCYNERGENPGELATVGKWLYWR